MEKLPIEKILEITGSYRATNVRVFGSWARREARPDSDLDLIVDVPRGTTLFDMAGMERQLEELLGIKVEVFTENSLHPRLKDRILAEAKTLVAA
jgi:predicted nucleotidyltransferase